MVVFLLSVEIFWVWKNWVGRKMSMDYGPDVALCQEVGSCFSPVFSTFLTLIFFQVFGKFSTTSHPRRWLPLQFDFSFFCSTNFPLLTPQFRGGEWRPSLHWKLNSTEENLPWNFEANWFFFFFHFLCFHGTFLNSKFPREETATNHHNLVGGCPELHQRCHLPSQNWGLGNGLALFKKMVILTPSLHSPTPTAIEAFFVMQLTRLFHPVRYTPRSSIIIIWQRFIWTFFVSGWVWPKRCFWCLETAKGSNTSGTRDVRWPSRRRSPLAFPSSFLFLSSFLLSQPEIQGEQRQGFPQELMRRYFVCFRPRIRQVFLSFCSVSLVLFQLFISLSASCPS